jgi:hypothetical protein
MDRGFPTALWGERKLKAIMDAFLSGSGRFLDHLYSRMPEGGANT